MLNVLMMNVVAPGQSYNWFTNKHVIRIKIKASFQKQDCEIIASIFLLLKSNLDIDHPYATPF